MKSAASISSTELSFREIVDQIRSIVHSGEAQPKPVSAHMLYEPAVTITHLDGTVTHHGGTAELNAQKQPRNK